MPRTTKKSPKKRSPKKRSPPKKKSPKKTSPKKFRNYLIYTGRRNKLYNQILLLENKTLLKLIPLLLLYNIFETVYDIKNI